MTEQERTIYEQDKLIARLQTELDIKTKQLDLVLDNCGCPLTDKGCDDFETCKECMQYFLDYVSKQ